MIHAQEVKYEEGAVKVFDGETYVRMDSLDKVFSGTIIMSALPTSDPTVAGQLWSNVGVLTVSAG